MPRCGSIRSSMMRKNRSSQLSPSCWRDADRRRGLGQGKAARPFASARSPANRCRNGARNASGTVSLRRVLNGSQTCRETEFALVPAAAAGCAHQAGAIRHQIGIGRTRPIPFRHGEFRTMRAGLLAVPEDMAQLIDPVHAGDQQLFHGEFGRGIAGSAASLSPSGISSQVAKALRCGSSPGLICSAGVSTSMKPSPSNHRRSALRMRAVLRGSLGVG